MRLTSLLIACSTLAWLVASEHADPWSLDLNRFVDKLLRDQAQYFPNATTAKNAIAEYRRFLHLHQKYPEHWVAASKLVDIVWHEHIIDTRRYMADSDSLFGRYLHHTPCFGKGRTFHHQNDMVKAYEETFGEFPREDIWEMPQVQASFPGCKTVPSPPGPPAPCPPPPPPSHLKLTVTEGKKDELCIDGGDGLDAVVTLQKCSSNHTKQGWDGSSYAQMSIQDAGWMGGVAGRCVELVDGNTTNGNHFTMECCEEHEHPEGYPKQQFHFNWTTGKLYYGKWNYSKPEELTKCIYAKAGQGGETLVIWDCQDVEGQKWEMAYMGSHASAMAVV